MADKVQINFIADNIAKPGFRVTAKNALVWFCTTAGHLLMILPRASVRLLLRLSRMFIDPKNRRVVVFILTTVALMLISRLLVDRANRTRLK